MKIAITADLHFGIEGRTDDILYALHAIQSYCEKNDIRELFILGDLFHDRRGTSWDVLGKVHAFFEGLASKGFSVLSFPGNHDQFMKNSWEFHSMTVMKDLINVFDGIHGRARVVGGTTFSIIPFINYEDAYMSAVRDVVKEAGKDDIILTHVGVKNASLNECFLNKHWSVVTFEDIPHKVYTGHFHCQQQVGSNVWYPGSPIAFNFTEGLVDHGFFVFDTDTQTHEFILIDDVAEKSEVRPPKFLTITDDMLGKVDVSGNNIRIAIARDYGKDEIDAIRHDLMAKGARSVSMMRAKESEVSLTSKEKGSLSIGRPEELLKVWVEKDAPDGISSDLLFKLNTSVIEEGNDRLIVKDVESNDD